VLKVSEFTTGTQRTVCNGFGSLFISLAASSKKRVCGNKMHNTFHSDSEIVSGHIYWGLGHKEINNAVLAKYLADRVTVAAMGTGNGLILIVGKRMTTD
jgi:hypothetical protein